MIFSILLMTLACGPKSPGAQVELSVVEAGQGDPLAVLSRGAAAEEVGVRKEALAALILYSEEPAGGSWGPRALFDPSPFVQRQAVDVLERRLDEPETRALLRAQLDRDLDPYTRGHLGVVLALAGDQSGRELLSAAWRAERQHWRRAPLALAAAMMGDTQALEQLQHDLARGSMPLELRFYRDCGRSGLPLGEALVAGAPRLEEELLLATAAALLALDDPEGQRLFRDALGSGGLEQRLEAIDYLAELPGPVSTELLRKARSAGPQVSRDYASLVLFARGEGPADAAFDAMVSLDRERRQQGAWAMARHIELVRAQGRQPRSARQGYRFLVAALGDPAPAVVEEAVRGLALVGEPGERGQLAGVMEGEYAGLQVEAAAAILAIEGRS